MITKGLRTLVIFLFAANALAATLPYNEAADAHAELRQALATAKTDRLSVLIIFGANWCGDCRALEASLQAKKNAELIKQSFVTVKVDVGNFNRNLDISESYGDPIKKGIPAAVILSPEGVVLYTTRAGELANARRMSDAGIYEFFKNAAASVQEEK